MIIVWMLKVYQACELSVYNRVKDETAHWFNYF